MGHQGNNILGLDVEEVNKDELEGDPGGVDGVQLPLGALPDAVHGDRVDLVVHDEGDVDGDVHDHHALGAELERQDLDGVGDEQTGPGEGVAHTVEPEEDDDGDAGALVRGLAVLRAGDGRGHEAQEHTSGGGEEERAATDAVTQHGARNGDDQGEDLVATVKTETSLGASDTGCLVDLVGVVGEESVAGPLREETERDDEHESVPVALGLEEVEVGGTLLGIELEADGLLDLLVLELHQRVVDVAVGVVLSENLQGLLGPLLGEQPTRRLGNPEDEHELDDGGEGLDQSRNSPRPVVVNVLCAERDPRADQGANVPQAVVDGCDTSAVLRVADLSEEQRSGELGERVAETHEETGALEHGQVDGGGLDRGGDDHDGATDDDGHTTTVVIRDEGDHGKRDERTDLVHGAETAEGHTGGSVHVGDPGREELHGVQHRTVAESQFQDLAIGAAAIQLTHRNQWWPRQYRGQQRRSRASSCWATSSS